MSFWFFLLLVLLIRRAAVPLAIASLVVFVPFFILEKTTSKKYPHKIKWLAWFIIFFISLYVHFQLVHFNPNGDVLF